ncbi:rod shape-determining protein MreD [Hymenobacter glacieicola]|uniref:Rod shape-determining protein MreD n=1 Tax=Hymenobacter glacieicola TaxID=1562124 RepID=A0ABQ1X3E3_9BACT|nr:rod shape-determining protein MreD [Hymenobacter glacieicola]
MRGGVLGIVWQLLRGVGYVALYVLLISGTDFVLFNLGWCFIYLGFLLFLPIATPIVVQLLLGFVTGVTLDIFFDTGGVHAAAAVLLMYLRPWVLRLLTPRDGYDTQDSVNIHQMGWQWMVVYLAMLTAMHHAAFFLLELGSFQVPGITLAKIVVSTLYTGLTLLIIQLVFFPTRRRNR